MTRRHFHLAAASLMFSFATLAVGNADAFEAKHTKSGKPVRWGTSTVELTISPSIDAVAPGARQALEIAIEGWSRAPHAPKIVVRSGAAEMKPSYDHTNLVYYAPDGFVPAGRALAVTVLTFDEATGDILDADIVINGRRGLELLEESAKAASGAHAVSTEGGSEREHEGASFDLAHVFAHETGHALGLSDEPKDAEALMYPFTMPGDASHRLPSDDDVAGVAQSYAGSSPAVAPSHGGCAVGRESSSSPPWAFLGSIALVISIARAKSAKRAQRAA